MRNIVIAGLLSILLPMSLIAQVPIEAGAFVGTTTYQGDLAENHVEFNELNLAYGGFVRYAFNPKLKMRGNVIYGSITGTDRNAKDLGLYNRGWTYDSYIVEMSLLMEYHPFGRPRTDQIGFFAPQVTPFIASGVGFINYDPSIEVSRFQDLNRFPENGATSSSISMPVIGGVTFDFSEKFLLGIEVGSRLTFNDYLDGVSQNGNPKKGDLFIFAGLCITYYVGYETEYSF